MEIKKDQCRNNREQDIYQDIANSRKVLQNEINGEEGDLGFLIQKISNEKTNPVANNLHENNIQECKKNPIELRN